jgi:hypothetical protein
VRLLETLRQVFHERRHVRDLLVHGRPSLLVSGNKGRVLEKAHEESVLESHSIARLEVLMADAPKTEPPVEIPKRT